MRSEMSAIRIDRSRLISRVGVNGRDGEQGRSIKAFVVIGSSD